MRLTGSIEGNFSFPKAPVTRIHEIPPIGLSRQAGFSPFVEMLD